MELAPYKRSDHKVKKIGTIAWSHVKDLNQNPYYVSSIHRDFSVCSIQFPSCNTTSAVWTSTHSTVEQPTGSTSLEIIFLTLLHLTGKKSWLAQTKTSVHVRRDFIVPTSEKVMEEFLRCRTQARRKIYQCEYNYKTRQNEKSWHPHDNSLKELA